MTKRLPTALTVTLIMALTLSLFAVSGCNLIYKQNVQQGNALVQEDLDELRLGMSMNQVAFLLGTPSIRDPFHHDRWDYVSSFSRRGGEPVMRKVSLRFENGALAEMTGVDSEFESADDTGADESSEIDGDTGADDTGAETVGDTGSTPPGEPDAGDTTEDLSAETAMAAAAAETVITPIDTPQAGVSELADDAEAVAEEISADADTAAEEAMAETEAGIEAVTGAEAETAAPVTEDEQQGYPAGTWVLQLGAFDERENADNLVAQLQDAGYAARIQVQVVAGLGERYLVRVGMETSQDEAEAALENIRTELGVNGFLIPPS